MGFVIVCAEAVWERRLGVEYFRSLFPSDSPRAVVYYSKKLIQGFWRNKTRRVHPPGRRIAEAPKPEELLLFGSQAVEVNPTLADDDHPLSVLAGEAE